MTEYIGSSVPCDYYYLKCILSSFKYVYLIYIHICTMQTKLGVYIHTISYKTVIINTRIYLR